MAKLFNKALSGFSGARNALAVLFVGIFAVCNSFADGIADLGAGIGEEVDALTGVVTTVGIAIIGVALVVGGVFLFKAIAKRVG